MRLLGDAHTVNATWFEAAPEATGFEAGTGAIGGHGGSFSVDGVCRIRIICSSINAGPG